MTVVEFPKREYAASEDTSAAVIGGALVASSALLIIAGSLFAVATAMVAGRAVAQGLLVLSDAVAHFVR